GLDRPRDSLLPLLRRQELVEKEPAQRLRRARVAREERALDDLGKIDEREHRAVEVGDVGGEGGAFLPRELVGHLKGDLSTSAAGPSSLPHVGGRLVREEVLARRREDVHDLGVLRERGLNVIAGAAGCQVTRRSMLLLHENVMRILDPLEYSEQQSYDHPRVSVTVPCASHRRKELVA